jgi:Mrp family chromosome partitioning ATPase
VLTLALPLVGLLLGTAVATILARASRRVLDEDEVTELLGLPFAATLPNERALRVRSLFQLQQLPDAYEEYVNELCVQVEAHAKLDMPLSVLVTGSQRVSGATTLAAAMAVRFGALGSRVVLVDLDFDQPDLSRCFGVNGDGFSELVAGRQDVKSGPEGRAAYLTATPLPNVSIVGRTPGANLARPQRSDLLTVLDTAVDHADVVVLDGGPMLAAPAAAVLAQHTDAVVLAVPVWRQERASLKVIARQLSPIRSRLLLVSMPRLKRSKRLPAGATRIDAEEREPEAAYVR